MAASIAQFREIKGGASGTWAGMVAAGGAMTTATTFCGFLTVSYDASSSPTITDSKGNTVGTGVGKWVLLTTVDSGVGSKLNLYAIWGGVGGSGHTITFSGSGTPFGVAYFAEVSGAITATTPFGAVVTSTGLGGSPLTVGSGTLDQADNLLVSVQGGSSNAIQPGSPWTEIDSEENNSDYWTSSLAALNVTSTANQNIVWTYSGGGSICNVALLQIRSAAAGGGGITGAGQIASSEAIGSAGLSATVAPAAIGSGEAFGSAAIGAGITTTGIPSAEAFGLPVVAPSGIVAAGIASAEVFGQPALSARINAAGAGSGEAVGQPVVGTPVTSTRTLGFEIGARTVSFKPLLQRVLEAKAPRVKPAKDRAQKRAKAIEVQGAEITLNGSATESKLRELASMWLAERPVMPSMLMQADPMAVYLAQVAFRIRQQQDEQQLTQAIAAKRRKDDDEAALVLLLA